MGNYLFIDGGYLRERFREVMRRYHNKAVELDISNIGKALGSKHIERSDIEKFFYYDCIDDTPRSGESDEDRAVRVSEQVKLFDSIRALPGWHVREGVLVGSRKQKRSQKRVDVLLAVEMLSHAVNKNTQRALLIAGDDDFTPLVDELLRHGTYVEVWSDQSSSSQHLARAADAGNRLTYFSYWSLTPATFRAENPLPDYGAHHVLPRGGLVLKHGRTSDGRVAKICLVAGRYHFCTSGEGGIISKVRAHDLRVLEAFLEDEHQKTGDLPEIWVESKQVAAR